MNLVFPTIIKFCVFECFYWVWCFQNVFLLMFSKYIFDVAKHTHILQRNQLRFSTNSIGTEKGKIHFPSISLFIYSTFANLIRFQRALSCFLPCMIWCALRRVNSSIQSNCKGNVYAMPYPELIMFCWRFWNRNDLGRDVECRMLSLFKIIRLRGIKEQSGQLRT